MLTLKAARKLLTGAVDDLPPVEASLSDAVGARLAAPVESQIELPANNLSVMDGYAVRSADLRVEQPLPVAFEVAAGEVPGALPPASVARIFTGAILPDEADAVVPQEQVERNEDGTVTLNKLPAGSFVRHRGELCSAGTVVGNPGELVTPRHLALFGSVGATKVRVIPRPRVAVISTGSELVPLDRPPAPGQIYDTNGPMMVALAQEARFPVVFATHVADQRGQLRSVLAEAMRQADLVVTSGGVSVGDYDYVPDLVADMGEEVLFHRLSIKPGRPALVARLKNGWFVGLPGNPLSAYVGWHMFVRPLGERLAGDPTAFDDRSVRAVLTEPASNRGGRLALSMARWERRATGDTVRVLPWKGSHDVIRLGQANALVVLEAGSELEAGAEVTCYKLD